MREPRLRNHLTIGLASFAVLFYQVAITRVLSVVLWYHFAFLSISLALLGIGAPGVWIALRRRAPGDPAPALLASGLAIPLSVVLIAKVGGRFPRAEYIDASPAGFLSPGILLTVVAVLAPFLCLGTAVCVLLLRAPGRRIAPLYGADLLGATLGAALVVPGLERYPTPQLIGSLGFLPLLCAPLYRARLARSAGAIAAALLVALCWGEPFRLRYTKKYDEAGRVIYERWTPTGRITVFPGIFYEPDPKAAFAWGMGERFRPRRIEQLWIEQDGSAGTPITKWTGAPEAVEHLFYDVTSFGYQLTRPERVCVIGSGGGRDILMALGSGAYDVDAVELNPHIVGVVSERFRDFSGDVYHMSGVKPVISEGRSYLTRTPERYDLIQVAMVDSWAATSAGAFALSENYLYTLEAFQLYWNRLTPRGVVSVSRWMMDRHLVEGARLVLLAKEALRRAGIQNPGEHIVVVQAKAVMTLIMSRRRFGPEGIEIVDRICADRGFFRHWPRGETTPATSLIPRLMEEGGGFLSSRGLDLSPPRDDRPFFFQAVPVIGRVARELVEQLSVNEQSVILLRRLLLTVGVLALALFFVPFVLAGRLGEVPSLRRGSAYFASIGLGFLLVEAAWVQRFILYLGHPSYATTVVLAAMLLGAGIGSIVARRARLRKVAQWGLVLPLFLAAVNASLPPLFHETIGWAVAGRVALSALLLGPSGFLMGFGFPCGMVRFGDEAKPWLWAMNGAFSVLGSVSSLALAMLLGHAAVAYAGSAFYTLALALFQGRMPDEASR